MRKIRLFGDPVLRQKVCEVSTDDISSTEIKELINEMMGLLSKDKYGVGLSAPQLGEPKSVICISIKPTPNRPDLEHFELVVFNPTILEVYGNKKQLWEGCCSLPSIYAKVPRYKSIKVRYQTQNKKWKTEKYEGFKAHVFQHEADHLNGILYVDKIRDKSTIITTQEYRKLRKQGLIND